MYTSSLENVACEQRFNVAVATVAVVAVQQITTVLL